MNLFTIEAEEAFPFEYNSETYSLLTMAHLSPEQEAEMQALWRKHDHLQKKIEQANPMEDKRIKELTLQVRECRAKMIAVMTTMPEELAASLPVAHQVKIMSYLGRDPDDIRKEIAERDNPKPAEDD